MEIELLVRAVIENDGRFLVAHTRGASNVYLPGGHIEHGEAMRSALVREIREELGIEVEVVRYLGAIEHAWEARGKTTHEINHVFEATTSDLSAETAPASREDHVDFFWLRADELEGKNLQPAPLQRLLANMADESPLAWWASTISPNSGVN